MSASDHLVRTIEQLESLYGEKNPNAIAKEINHINGSYRQLIEAAPFVAVATSGPEGLDCSPKGDPRGFVRILDDKTIAIPDRPGNNRLDGFRNIPAADKAAAREALIRLSWLAYEHPELKEIEINPLRVLESGALALDVRYRL